MSIQEWKPAIGEHYFIISSYNADPYEHVWEGSKADRAARGQNPLSDVRRGGALEAKKNNV